MNTNLIDARMYWQFAESREIPGEIPIPDNETEPARIARESKQKQIDDQYVAWQISPEPFVFPINEFVAAVEYLITELTILPDDATDAMLMVPFYDAAKKWFGDAEIRTFFKYLYFLVFDNESGPRWSQVINVFGKQQFVNLLIRETNTNVFNPTDEGNL